MIHSIHHHWGGGRVCGDRTERLLSISDGGGSVRTEIDGFMRKQWESISNKVNIWHLIFDLNSITYVETYLILTKVLKLGHRLELCLLLPRDYWKKFSVSLYGSRPLKLSVSISINPERANWTVVMETDSLGGREPENKTDNFGRSSRWSFYLLGPSGSM